MRELFGLFRTVESLPGARLTAMRRRLDSRRIAGISR